MNAKPLDSHDRVVLSRHADLKRRSQGDVLVLPERAIALAGSGSEILLLCDGERTLADVARALDERYPGTEGLASEVHRFLTEMRDLGGVIEAPSP